MLSALSWRASNHDVIKASVSSAIDAFLRKDDIDLLLRTVQRLLKLEGEAA